MTVATVNQTRAEPDVMPDAVSWSSTVRPRKKMLETSNQVSASVDTHNPMSRVTINLGERRTVLVADVLRVRLVLSAARGALRWLKEAALQADAGTRRASQEGINPSKVKADNHDHHVRRVSDQPPSAR